MLDGATEDTEPKHWQGNVDTRPGDIAIVWCRSPRAYVHSIWRATSRGYADPFAYYYRQVRIAHPVQVPHVTFAELQADPTWSQTSAVRAHFQNCSGRAVEPEQYAALLAILKRKGCDVAQLPQITPRPSSIPAGIESERDVEEQLLEPLLVRLGYSPTDWVRQFPLRMGRGERVYPDYAFGLSGGRGEEAARIIAEAKFRILNHDQLREAYLQARSYAERLRAQQLVLCALEGVWVFARKRGEFAASEFAHRTWEECLSVEGGRDLENRFGKTSAVWKNAVK